MLLFICEVPKERMVVNTNSNGIEYKSNFPYCFAIYVLIMSQLLLQMMNVTIFRLDIDDFSVSLTT